MRGDVLRQPGFPEAEDLDYQELFHFRDWQGEAVVKPFYYGTIILGFSIGVAQLIYMTAVYARQNNTVGGIFIGLILLMVFTGGSILVGRIMSEIFLTVFSLRDSIMTSSKRGSSGGAGAAASPQGSPNSGTPPVDPSSSPSSNGGGGGGYQS